MRSQIRFGGAGPPAPGPGAALIVRLCSRSTGRTPGGGKQGQHIWGPSGVQVGLLLVQYLLRPEVVIAQRLIRLIQPVLPAAGAAENSRTGSRGLEDNKAYSGVKRPASTCSRCTVPESGEECAVALRRGPTTSGLTAPPCEAGGVAAGASSCFEAVQCRPGSLPHRGQNASRPFLSGAKQSQLGRGGQLNVQAQPSASSRRPPVRIGQPLGNGLWRECSAESVLSASSWKGRIISSVVCPGFE